MYISDLVVRAAHRGRELMMRAESFAREFGAKQLKVGVLVRNEATHAFYRAGGFRDYTVQLVKLLDETSCGAGTPSASSAPGVDRKTFARSEFRPCVARDFFVDPGLNFRRPSWGLAARGHRKLELAGLEGRHSE
jgi:hypothetical protein